jgi:uncharacterized protein involved in exopolysaccharide biosynthesis
VPDEQPIRGEVAPSVPTLRDLAMVLFRQRKLFAWAAGLVLAMTILYAAGGATYQANMKVMVRRGRAEAPVSAGENAPLDLTRMAITEEELNSEVELLRDDEVLRKVVQQTGGSGRDWFHFLRLGETPAERTERMARRLAKKISIEPVKKTNLIAIRYAAGDPEKAAKVLKSLADVYLEKHMTVHRPVGELGFFEQQTAESRRRLEESNRQLRQFTMLHGVVAAALQRDLALQKLSELDAGARQTRVDVAETQERVGDLEQQLAKLPERTTTQIRTADNPELLKALKSNLLDLQLKRTELLMKFEPNHRLVREVDEQIAQAQAAIAGESLSPLRDETTDKDPQYEWAKAELQRARVQLKGLQAREDAALFQEAAFRFRAQKLGQEAITQEDLLSSEHAAQENYLLYIKKTEEARMNDALDQEGIVNVAIAEQPVAPALPLWSAWTVLAIGVFGAGAVGTSAVFVADYLDPSFRDPQDVNTYLKAPVLASLPRGDIGRLSA